MTTFSEQLQQQTQEAVSDWANEQDRGDWFETEAYRLAAILDAIERRAGKPSK